MKTLIKIIILLAVIAAVYLTVTDKWGEVANLGKTRTDQVMDKVDDLKDSAVKGVEKAVDSVKDKADELAR